MTSVSTLKELFLDEVKDLLNAERQLVRALPRMIHAATSVPLKDALAAHLAETETHVDRMEEVLTSLGEAPRGKKCKGMEGILEEGSEMLDTVQMPALDAAIVSSGQRVEHYEICGYGVIHEWAKTLTLAKALPEDALHESVNGEWSFVQTLRHLVFAMDKWFTAPILGEGFDPIGLPNTGSVGFPWPALDYDLTPSVSDALAVRAERATRFGDYLESVATTDFTRPIEVLENGTNPLQECLYTVLEEEFWHNRYARRDLAQLDAAKQDPA